MCYCNIPQALISNVKLVTLVKMKTGIYRYRRRLILPDEQMTPMKLVGVIISFAGVIIMIGAPAIDGRLWKRLVSATT